MQVFDTKFFFVKKVCLLVCFFVSTICHANYKLLIDSLYSEVKQEKNEAQQAVIYKEMIFALVNDDWELQNKIFAEAEPILRRHSDIYYACLEAIAWSGVIVGEFEKVDSIYNFLQIEYKNNLPKLKYLYSHIALYYYSISQLPLADSLIQLSYIDKDTTVSPDELNGIYNTRAIINLEQGKLKEALENLDISLKYANLRGSTGAISIAYGNLFYLHFDKGNINKSIEYLSKSLNFHLGRRRSKVTDAETYITLLDLYVELGLTGLEETQMFDIAKSLVEEMNAVTMQFDLGLIQLNKYLSQNKAERSFQIIQELEKFVENNNIRLYLPRLYNAQIRYYLLIENLTEAKKAIDKLYNLSIAQDMKQYQLMSYYYYSQIDKTKAISLLEKAYDLADSLENNKLKLKCLDKLATEYTNKKDFQKSSDAYAEIAELQDSVSIDAAGLNTLTNLINSVQTYLNISTSKVKLHPKEKTNSSYLIPLFICLFLGGFLIITFLLYQSHKKKHKQLKLKELELEKQMIWQEKAHASQDNKNEPEELAYIEKIDKIEELKKLLISNQIEWSQFLLEYEALSPDFLKKCRKLEIKLTNNTIRHLLCIRMHLTIKESAALNGVGVDAVKKARYRIKKQFKLEPSESLVEYISTL